MGYKSLPLASIELPQPRHEAMAAVMRQKSTVLHLEQIAKAAAT
jgi:hypothetical protein